VLTKALACATQSKNPPGRVSVDENRIAQLDLAVKFCSRAACRVDKSVYRAEDTDSVLIPQLEVRLPESMTRIGRQQEANHRLVAGSNCR
jgi:hypothetical protein